VTDKLTAVRRPPVPVGLGHKPRLAQRLDPTLPSTKITRHANYHPEHKFASQPRSVRPWRSLALVGTALAGIGVSIYTCILHFAHVAPACSSIGAINCEKVLTSPQSVFLGIPVPIYGIAFFVIMLTACIPKLWRTTHRWIPQTRLAVSSLGIVFALGLVYEELFVIHSLCLWCTATHLLSFAMFILIVTGWEDTTRNVIPRRTT